MSVLVSWWRTPENALDTRFATFDIQGVVPIAYALFAVALGIAVGAAIRRVLPAIAMTLAGFVAVRAVIALYLRPHYLAAVGKVMALGAPKNPAGAWVISAGLVGPGGKFYSGGIDIQDMPAACQVAFPGGKSGVLPCMVAHGFHQSITYQPASRFWAFQGIEAAIFLVLALALVGFAWWWVRSHEHVSAHDADVDVGVDFSGAGSWFLVLPSDGEGPFSLRCSRLQRT